MKAMLRLLPAMTLLAALTVSSPVTLRAQKVGTSPQTGAPAREHMDEPETNSQVEQYRHSPTVQTIARYLHIKTETAADIFEDINSGVLLFVIGYFLLKFIPGIFRRRSETLQKDLTTAQAATEDANRRLAAVEARLSRLDGEIEAIRQQAERDSAEDEKRIHAALESERERIIASAEQEITATQAAAQRELKKFAADLAIDNAARRIQLSMDTDRALVKEFGAGLQDQPGGKA